jgi:hypothetical protein
MKNSPFSILVDRDKRARLKFEVYCPLDSLMHWRVLLDTKIINFWKALESYVLAQAVHAYNRRDSA